MIRIDTHDKWAALLDTLEAVPGFTQLEWIAGTIGVLLVVKILWSLAIGKGFGKGSLAPTPGGHSGGFGLSGVAALGWTCLIAALCLAPPLVSVVLRLVDAVCNAVLAIGGA